jgi:hypothetical protein
MKDIDELLSEAEIGKQSAVFNRITDEAMPFWQGIVERIETGKAIHRILRDEFDVHISESAIRKRIRDIQNGK